MTLFSDIYYELINLAFILKNPNPSFKFKLFFTYLKISIKLRLQKIFNLNIINENFLGVKVSFSNYYTFYRLFNEIFVREEYSFRLKNSKPIIIDCGSNIGMSILYFKMKHPSSEVLGFEPHHETFLKLSHNIKSNFLSAQVEEAALSEKKGTINLFYPLIEKGSLGNTTKKNMIRDKKQWNTQKVRAVKLSDYVNKPIDLLKIDIEGSETSVIKDLASNNKLRFIEKILLEFHYTPHLKNNSFSELINILERAGFLFVMESKNIVAPYYNYHGKGVHLLIYAYKL